MGSSQKEFLTKPDNAMFEAIILVLRGTHMSSTLSLKKYK